MCFCIIIIYDFFIFAMVKSAIYFITTSFLIFTLDGADNHMITDEILKTKNLPIIVLILLIKEYIILAYYTSVKNRRICVIKKSITRAHSHNRYIKTNQIFFIASNKLQLFQKLLWIFPNNFKATKQNFGQFSEGLRKKRIFGTLGSKREI